MLERQQRLAEVDVLEQKLVRLAEGMPYNANTPWTTRRQIMTPSYLGELDDADRKRQQDPRYRDQGTVNEDDGRDDQDYKAQLIPGDTQTNTKVQKQRGRPIGPNGSTPTIFNMEDAGRDPKAPTQMNDNGSLPFSYIFPDERSVSTGPGVQERTWSKREMTDPYKRRLPQTY